MIYIIGCGGAGSWLAPALARIVKPENITLVDGDNFEKSNLDRQLFDESSLGRNKAEALADLYRCNSVPKWYSEHLLQHFDDDVIFGAVDNHPARRSILNACDMAGCWSIFGANETFSSEAYIYRPDWRGCKADPRVMYPEIETSNADDPRSAGSGCVGAAQTTNRQLVSANFMAASMMLHLFVLWAMEAPKYELEALEHLPHKLVNNLSKNETHKLGKVQPKE